MQLIHLQGAQIRPWLDALAALRIQVFREFPISMMVRSTMSATILKCMPKAMTAFVFWYSRGIEPWA